MNGFQVKKFKKYVNRNYINPYSVQEFQSLLENIDERIQLYLHYPLSIFKSKKDLRNVRIVSSVINQYPLILDTILKITEVKSLFPL